MKIAISAGHNPHRPGAHGPNTTEYAEAGIMAAFAIRHLQNSGHQAFMIRTGAIKQKVIDVNSLSVDCAIEFHLNHANGSGNGCETLYCPGSTAGMALASNIHEVLSKAIGNRDRGIKEGWYRGDQPGVVDYPGDIDGDEAKLYFLRATNCPAVIVEPWFIDTEAAAFNGGCEIAQKVGEAVSIGIQKQDWVKK